MISKITLLLVVMAVVRRGHATEVTTGDKVTHGDPSGEITTVNGSPIHRIIGEFFPLFVYCVIIRSVFMIPRRDELSCRLGSSEFIAETSLDTMKSRRSQITEAI
ncbi:hypothetical protein QAD02_018632 [Eretmocerus hayati]|uniref:Uncharacterized protein n=1 Tax=Eretmocerus hayati TaxID=131215 RepID=A0ACC2PGX7_9HYME|nr:hypothetical protein QAD02_018632 [Eretmocerus hayati]